MLRKVQNCKYIPSIGDKLYWKNPNRDPKKMVDKQVTFASLIPSGFYSVSNIVEDKENKTTKYQIKVPASDEHNDFITVDIDNLYIDSKDIANSKKRISSLEREIDELQTYKELYEQSIEKIEAMEKDHSNKLKSYKELYEESQKKLKELEAKINSNIIDKKV